MEQGFTVNLLIPSHVPKAHFIGEQDGGQEAAAEGPPISQHCTRTCSKIWVSKIKSRFTGQLPNDPPKGIVGGANEAKEDGSYKEPPVRDSVSQLWLDLRHL